MRLLLSLLGVVCLFVAGASAQTVAPTSITFLDGIFPSSYSERAGNNTRIFDVPVSCQTDDSWTVTGTVSGANAAGPINANESWLSQTKVEIRYFHSGGTIAYTLECSPSGGGFSVGSAIGSPNTGYPLSFSLTYYQKFESYGTVTWVSIGTSSNYTINYQ